MDRMQALIGMLADGEWHSGEKLADAMGVSRAAVWKRLQGLSDLGLALERRHGRGYRLAQPLQLLDVDVIRQSLDAASKQAMQDIRLCSTIDSTNSQLMQSDTAPAVLLAEHQTAGRGRRGRQWCSPYAANLTFSLAWRFDSLPPQLPALSLVVGIAIAEALSEIGLSEVALKWPNDVYWQGRKLAGVLIEHRGEASGPCRAVVGVGLNVAMSAEQGADIDQAWVSLHEAMLTSGLTAPTRSALAAVLIGHLVRALTEFEKMGFDAFRQRWAKRDWTHQQPVRIELESSVVEGIAKGLDRDGALRVQVGDEQRRFFSGEVSLRAKA